MHQVLDNYARKVTGGHELTWEYVRKLLTIATVLLAVNAGIIIIAFPLCVHVHPALGGGLLLAGMCCHACVMFVMWVLEMRMESVGLFILSCINIFIILLMSISGFTDSVMTTYGSFCFLCAIYILLLLWGAACVCVSFAQHRNMFPEKAIDVTGHFKRLLLISCILIGGLVALIISGFPIAWYVHGTFGAALLLVGLACPIYIAFMMFVLNMRVYMLWLIIISAEALLGCFIMGIGTLAKDPVRIGTFYMLTGLYTLIFLCCVAAFGLVYVRWRGLGASDGSHAAADTNSTYVPPQFGESGAP